MLKRTAGDNNAPVLKSKREAVNAVGECDSWARRQRLAARDRNMRSVSSGEVVCIVEVPAAARVRCRGVTVVEREVPSTSPFYPITSKYSSNARR